MREAGQICYGTVTPPEPDCTGVPVLISDEVMEKRCAAVMARMEEENLDSLVVYGDLEHGQNFAYLTGFLPRFEEALLVLNRNGHHTMLMGNENLNKVSCARIKAQAVHVPFFSLPNQPMQSHGLFSEGRTEKRKPDRNCRMEAFYQPDSG